MRRPTTTNPPKAEPRASVNLVRCAIYTRKSTEEGLEQEFNSLDAQREAGEAYVRSQADEGWALPAGPVRRRRVHRRQHRPPGACSG